MRKSALLTLVLLSASNAFAWGEHGHHLVGSVAARIVGTTLEPTTGTVDRAAFLRFFRDRDIAIGHLSNIPDTSWKDKSRMSRINAMNSPNHWFGPERILGVPPTDAKELARYEDEIRKLAVPFAELRAKHEGIVNPLPGGGGKKLSMYFDLGTTPWRAQQLYTLLVSAFACAKSKESGPANGNATLAFNVPKDRIGHADEPVLPTYQCRADTGRRQDLHAAVIIAGILSHFVGDQSQPYHPTADHDGWATGNGGIHVYFESIMVQAMGYSANQEVYDLAVDPAFQADLWSRVGTDVTAPNGVVQLLINQGIDSARHKDAVRKADEAALISKSDALPMGAGPVSGQTKYAVRKDAYDPDVQAAMRPVAVERIASGAVLLAKLYSAAYVQGGAPSMGDLNAVSFAYPLDPPYIWNDYDPAALASTRITPPASPVANFFSGNGLFTALFNAPKAVDASAIFDACGEAGHTH